MILQNTQVLYSIMFFQLKNTNLLFKISEEIINTSLQWFCITKQIKPTYFN